MSEQRTVGFVGVPMDLGGGRRGTDMGPNALRIADLERHVRSLGFGFEDHGNVHVREPKSRIASNPKAKYLEEIADCCASLKSEVEGILAEGRLPLVAGGDHSIAVGTVAGISSHYHRLGQRVGLFWFDAHGDLNTPETSESGNIHGMPLACCLGRGPDTLTKLSERMPMIDVDCSVLLGVRSLDKGEIALIREMGIKCFTMREIDLRGIHSVMEEALEIVCKDTAGFHLSFDLDGTDPAVSPGVGTPVPGGTTYRESHAMLEMVAGTNKLVGLEMTEINPILDNSNQTARVAVEFVLSALGKLVL